MAYFCLVMVCILWGTTWVVSAYSVRRGVSALQVAGMRQLLGGVILCVSIWLFKKGKVELAPWKDTIFLAIINFVCSNGLSTWGVKYLPAGLASIIGASYPLWMVLIYFLFFNRKVSPKVWIGMIVSFIGLIIVFYPTLIKADYPSGFLFGLALSVFSSITWSIGTIYTKSQTQKKVNPYFNLGLQMIISGIILTGVLVSGNHFTPLHAIATEVYLGIIYLTFMGSIVAFSCFIYALKHLTPEQVSVYAYVNPIVATILSSFYLNEKITLVLIVGAVVVLLGIYLLNKAFK